MQRNKQTGSPLLVILAFAAVYIVWGSTYFFIQRALEGFSPFLLGAVRFIIAGILLLGWSLLKGEKVFNLKAMRHAAISGLLMLFIGNGIVIWVEQTLPSAMVAIMVSSSPLWFVILDKHKWAVNFSSRNIILGLTLGFAGVVLLFGERLIHAFSSTGTHSEIFGLFLLTCGVIAWVGGSLYTKYVASGASAMASTSWQMLFAGIAFLPGGFLLDEFRLFRWEQVSSSAWISLVYLITMGSIVGFSAYVFLLRVRSATQVSTFAYVNPVVAVILGVTLANEHITIIQITGLVIILLSVLLVNISTYRKKVGNKSPDDEFAG